ncbi:tRNA lysidine(34) synthetase TilS [Ramlibacter sp. MMS24-I3-19]|uniref:tRNA lysidine(34) synthetase TilS n=1 Tax=Ramlibacter sp. MMS24-I3-19 TaxID=3416606 RepID=UPI003CFCB41A
MNDRLVAALTACAPRLPVGVAFSGGADSMALLAIAARHWPGQVHALHVNHGLQQAAEDFERHCAKACERWRVPLHVEHANARHAPGDSPEEAARHARYRSLAALATANGLGAVLLAQHADDQVETLLLALSRGAGLPGMAAMPARFERHGVLFLRPWLDVPGVDLRAWLASEGLRAIEDPTNNDIRYTRNRIRHGVVPALAAAFPQYRETFARSARHAAQAQELLAEVAAQDLAAMQGEPRIGGLQALSRARQANVLRHWLAIRHAARASTAQMDELLDQVACCTTRGHDVRLRVGDGFVQRQDDRLAWSPSV